LAKRIPNRLDVGSWPQEAEARKKGTVAQSARWTLKERRDQHIVRVTRALASVGPRRSNVPPTDRNYPGRWGFRGAGGWTDAVLYQLKGRGPGRNKDPPYEWDGRGQRAPGSHLNRRSIWEGWCRFIGFSSREAVYHLDGPDAGTIPRC